MQQAGVPYLLWAIKFSPLLEEDFQSISAFIDRCSPTWTEALEGLFKILERRGTLHKSVPAFARLSLMQDEDYKNFAWRMRDAFFVEIVPAVAERRITVRHFAHETVTMHMVKSFVAANVGHIRDAAFAPELLVYIHAIRFWATVAGFVTSTTQTEYTVVDPPSAADINAVPDEMVNRIREFSADAMIALAAQAISCRKSNHVTGGTPATGFPRRWLQKLNSWKPVAAPDVAPGRNAEIADQQNITSIFYVATHAAGLHPVLAMMAGTDDAHWAQINVRYGFIHHYEFKSSVVIRISPRTQVAGVAMVVDTYQALKLLTSEAIAPLLLAKGEVEALVRAYQTVESNGIRVAPYGNWFLTQGLLRYMATSDLKCHLTSSIISKLQLVPALFYQKENSD